MHLKGLLQVFGRPWLIEESQGVYWAEIAQQMLVEKTLSAIPGRDPRTFRTKYFDAGVMSDVYDEIFRVNEKGVMAKDGRVQVIQLKGPLMEDDYCGAPGMMVMQQVIRAVKADQTIDSIVLWHDSPGGTVSGTHNLAREIKASGKPVVSFVNKMMCSADYWIGSSAQEIIADDENGGYNSMIGSIGTKATIVDRSKEMENKGIKIRHVYADKSSRKGKYSDDVFAGDDTRLKTELNKINSVFLSDVQNNRAGKLKLDQEDVLEGDVYNVKDSLKWGLIDKMGPFEYAVKRSLQLAKTIK